VVMSARNDTSAAAPAALQQHCTSADDADFGGKSADTARDVWLVVSGARVCRAGPQYHLPLSAMFPHDPPDPRCAVLWPTRDLHQMSLKVIAHRGATAAAPCASTIQRQRGIAHIERRVQRAGIRACRRTGRAGSRPHLRRPGCRNPLPVPTSPKACSATVSAPKVGLNCANRTDPSTLPPYR